MKKGPSHAVLALSEAVGVPEKSMTLLGQRLTDESAAVLLVVMERIAYRAARYSNPHLPEDVAAMAALWAMEEGVRDV